MNVALLINVLTILNLFLVAFILFSKSGSTSMNRLLALVLFFPALFYLRHFAELMGYIQVVPYLLFPTQILGVLFGPLVYAYVRIKLSDKRWQHPVFFPLSVSLMLFTVAIGLHYTFFLSRQEQIAYALQVHSGNFPVLFLISKVAMTALHFCYLLISFIWTLRIVMNCKYATDSEKQKIQFVFQFVILNFGLLVLLLISYAMISVHYVDSYILPLTGAFFYLFVFYKMFQYPNIFQQQSEGLFQAIVMSPGNRNAVGDENVLERSKNGVSEDVLDAIYADLVRYMENDKPYLNPELTLRILSDNLKICTHKLSLAINEKSGNNFFNFINSYRIAEAKRLLCDSKSKSYNIEDIAFMSGFNSRASFYSAFKKQLNQTPSAYLADLRSNNSE